MENADQTYPPSESGGEPASEPASKAASEPANGATTEPASEAASEPAKAAPYQGSYQVPNPAAGQPYYAPPQGYSYPTYQYPYQYPGAQPYQPPYPPYQPYYQPAPPYQSANPYSPYGYVPYDYAPYGAGAYYPYPTSPYGPAPTAPQQAAPAAAPSTAQQESPAWHSLKWILAVIGVFFAVLGIQVVATFAVMIVAILVGGGIDSVMSWVMGDGLIIVEVIIQLVWLAVAVPWWLHVRKRGIGLFRDKTKEDAEDPLNIAWRVLGIIMLGFGAQIAVALVLNLVLPLFPDVMTSYESLMEDTGLASEGIFTLIASAVLAPFVEEFTFRGIVMQFSLRAMCQQWTGRLTRENLMKMRVMPQQFWLANIFQAAVFGIMHLNLVQGLYAFVLGLVLGWVFWRTGKLRWCIGLHVAFNFSGYVLDGMYVALGGLGFVGLLIEVLVAIALVVGGILLFRRFTKPTALGE